MNVLITGGNGYVANRIYKNLMNDYDVTKVSRKDFSLTDYQSTKDFFRDKYFDVVIHCAISGGHRLQKDNIEVLDNNLKMYYNLLENKDRYRKFINIGSGAEVYANTKPYGMSKSIIRESVLDKENFYSLRVYAVFDEEELETRFMKANLIKYIKGQSMEVYQDRLMDFFYMEDFCKVMRYYIDNDNIPHREYECAYDSELPQSLMKIAKIINDLNDKKVEIKLVDENHGTDYIAKTKTKLPIEFVGLKQGIVNVYNKLK
jgi:nucleoside-diphosphate-sugar epimerase